MDFTPIFQGVIALAAAVVSVVVIPYLKRKVNSENLGDFLAWVDIAVAAAEQLYDKSAWAQKKSYVVQFLARKGVTFSEEEIDNAIEASVNALHHQLYGQAVSEDVEQP